MMLQRAKKGMTESIVAVFVDAGGAPKTGLTVSVRIRRASDGHYVQSDSSWSATPTADPVAGAVDATHSPGVYGFSFALPDSIDEYAIRFDGGEAAANRYQFGMLRAVAEGDGDLHVVRAVLANTQQQTIATGVVTIFDDDGETPLVTLTPGVDDSLNPTKNILTAGIAE